MSSIKEYYFEKQQENCIAWIREQYGIEIDPDEHPDAWEDLAGEYSAMLEAEEAEYQWLNRHTHSEFFLLFANELATASSLLNVGTPPSTPIPSASLSTPISSHSWRS
ncbi:hypothetical protein [Pseudomonas sp. BNK-30]|uniref:hypothetical protein n=1 Tax=Pseudomonas sp. BNK-30 TaxID=3376165 RepID=UPI0039BF149A